MFIAPNMANEGVRELACFRKVKEENDLSGHWERFVEEVALQAKEEWPVACKRLTSGLEHVSRGSSG